MKSISPFDVCAFMKRSSSDVPEVNSPPELRNPAYEPTFRGVDDLEPHEYETINEPQHEYESINKADMDKNNRAVR